MADFGIAAAIEYAATTRLTQTGTSLGSPVYKAIRGIATMRSRQDGRPPELNLGLHSGRHTALDPDIVIHEYVHGMTNRIVGGRHVHDP